MSHFHHEMRAGPLTDLPTAADWRRNDLAVFATALVLLLLGWAVAGRARDNAQTVDLGLGLPMVSYPAQWTRGRLDDGDLFYARNPGSPSAYSAAVAVTMRPVLAGESLATVRADIGFQRSRTLDRYRELSALPVSVLEGVPGVLTTYASLADPTHDSGLNGLPVVVQGQDLIFQAGNRWIIASTSVDAARADGERDAFALFFDSLGLETIDLPAPAPAAASATPVPAAAPPTPAPVPVATIIAPGSGFQSQPPSGVNP